MCLIESFHKPYILPYKIIPPVGGKKRNLKYAVNTKHLFFIIIFVVIAVIITLIIVTNIFFHIPWKIFGPKIY